MSDKVSEETGITRGEKISLLFEAMFATMGLCLATGSLWPILIFVVCAITVIQLE